MGLEKVISVSGQPGLYKVISQTGYGLIAEALEDGKRIPVYSSYKVSSLGDISIYTEGDDMPLNDVLLRIKEKENSKPLNNLKASDNDIRNYFGEVLPEFDKERVYTSDIRKLFKWYNLLLKHDLITKDEAESEATAEESADSKATKKETKAKDGEKAKKAAPKAATPKTPKADSRSKGSPKVNTPRKAQ
jgi:pyruvate/2-oxoglutarate dehydrogenase complex dihydrolipoamide acyltransferase (E2) component